MSGVKKGTVTNSLNRTLSMVRRGVAECEEAAAAAGAVGRVESDRRLEAAERVHRSLRRRLPDDLREFLRGETSKWESQLGDHDAAFSEAGRIAAEANATSETIASARSGSDRQLDRIEQQAASIRLSMEDKDWYCDAENAQAEQLRREAEGVLAEMRRSVNAAREVQELRRRGFEKLVEAEELAQSAEREFDRLLELARDRQEKQRIAEENRREALNLQSDLASLRSAIEGRDYAKFGGGRYSDDVRHELDRINDLVSADQFEEAIPASKSLKGRMKAVLDAIDVAETAWKSAKAAAEKALSDAREECAGVNREDLLAYCGKPAVEVGDCFAAINGAADDISAEAFDVARTRIGEAMGRLRALRDAADENRKLESLREEIAQSIMQALYDSNYDTPSYYLKDEADRLSDLCVVASAPGGVGDMKMRVALSGGVSFEVANIPEGREQLCVDAVRKMQEKLAAEDIRFNVTDWGRAENQNKVHLNTVPRQRQNQRQIQRQG